jgi:uncharacterized membrane protein required for colicin V production
MNLGDLNFNWFDLAVLIVISIGILRGRSRGMSEELLDVFKWLVIVFLGGMAYRPAGAFLVGYTHVSPTAAYVAVYAFVIVMVRLCFNWFKRLVGEKLVGSDVFGRGEYYLGMIAGAVRFACYLVVGMALLHATPVTAEQLAAQARMQQDNFGDISFPTLGSMQQTVFAGSASGRFTKKYLAHELIVSTPGEKSESSGDTLGRQRERMISEVLGERK